MTSFQTDPFSKYLYSGAFYIQAINSYRLVSEWLVNEEPEQRDALQSMIKDSWLQTAMKAYSSPLSGMGLPNTLMTQANNPPKIAGLTEMLTRIVPQITSEIIDRVSSHAGDTLTLQDFFEVWIETFSKAHAKLINSEKFIDCMTEFINFSIKASVEVMKDTEPDNE